MRALPKKEETMTSHPNLAEPSPSARDTSFVRSAAGSLPKGDGQEIFVVDRSVKDRLAAVMAMAFSADPAARVAAATSSAST